MPLTEVERAIVKTVVEEFLSSKEPTPRLLLVKRFRSPQAFYRLTNISVLKRVDGEEESFLPLPLAFHYCGDQDIIRTARTAVEGVLRILQGMFDGEWGRKQFTPGDVEAHAQKMHDLVDPETIKVDPETIKLGLYLVQDFGVLGSWQAKNAQQTELAMLAIAENIVTFKDVTRAWDEYIEQRTGYIDNPPNKNTIGSFALNVAESSGDQKPAIHSGLLVFISHSSKDADLALALIELLKSGLGLLASQIRCSSVDGYRLPVGVNTENKLREEVNAATVVIGLITPSSLSSSFVMFELGARWGANLFLAPLLAGVRASELRGPLSLLNALSANNDAQLHQLLDDVSRELGLPLQNAASYVRHISAVKALADGLSNPVTTQPASVAARLDLKMSLSAEGTPPKQVVRLVANQTIAVSRLEYMLTNETCIVSEDVSLEGETLEVPLSHDLLTKLWNTPRADRNHYDHSGPAKVGLTVSIDGRTRQYVLPVQMDNFMQNNTMYRRLVGSKTFYGVS